MRALALDSWIVAGLLMALVALAVSIVRQVRDGRRSTRPVVLDLDREPVRVVSFSGTIELKPRRAR